MKKNFSGFYNCRSKEELKIFKEELLTDYPNECKALINKSDRFVSGIYIFDSEWDMERSFTPVKWEIKNIKWFETPNADLEWLYMLARHNFLVDVALAYMLTEDEKYSDYLEEFLREFLKYNPLNEFTKNYSWRTIDVGLRMVSWVKLLELNQYLPLLSKELTALIEKECLVQGKYLNGNLAISRGQSNWQILEIAGLYAASVVFEDNPTFKKWRENSWFYLEKSLNLQVEADGIQREQSFMYHNEVLYCLLEILQLANRTGDALNQTVVSYGEKLAKASSIFVKPNGLQDVYGDSDVEDMTGMLSYAEVILEEKEPLNEAASLLPIFTKLALGKGQYLIENKYFLQKAGHFFLQVGIMVTKDETNYLLFKCGPLGGGHGHDDLLHFDYTFKGQDILIDAGRYTYDWNKGRLPFKEAKAHNTIIVDGKNFNQHTDPWNSLKTATPFNQKYVQKEDVSYFEGGHLGYFDLSDPVIVNRKLLHFKEGYTLISDEYFCQKEHEITTRFHFATQNLKIVDAAFAANDLNFSLNSSNEDAQFLIEEKEVSSYYNERHFAKSALVKKQITGTSVASYLLYPTNLVITFKKIPIYAEDILLEDNICEAFKLELAEGKTQIIILQHQEVNFGRRAYQVEGNYYYGRVIVIDNPGENETRKVLY